MGAATASPRLERGQHLRVDAMGSDQDIEKEKKTAKIVEQVATKVQQEVKERGWDQDSEKVASDIGNWTEEKMRSTLGDSMTDRLKEHFGDNPSVALMKDPRFRSAALIYFLSSAIDLTVIAPFAIVGTVSEMLSDPAIVQGVIFGLRRAGLISKGVGVKWWFDIPVSSLMTSMIGVPDVAVQGAANSTVGAGVNPAAVMFARVTMRILLERRAAKLKERILRRGDTQNVERTTNRLEINT